MALHDLTHSFARAPLAWALARHDIGARYRGSILGPFWITLSMGTMALGLGVLYTRLFHMDIHEFLPFVAVGMVVWNVISSMLNEGCETFTMAAGILRQSSLPLLTFVWRTLFRTLIAFAHHVIIIIAVLIWARWTKGNYWLPFVGLALVLLNLTWAVLLTAIVSARFRDVPQIISSLTQFVMFMTPIFWKPSQIGHNHAILIFNPFYYMIDVIRSPILGQPVDPRNWIVLIIAGLLGWGVALLCFATTRRKIVHFL
jgi:ABC-type polysaccharide/polyol phosphate export permease